MCASDLNEISRQLEVAEARVVAIDVELDQMSCQPVANVQVEKRGTDVVDLDALRTKFDEANVHLTKLSVSRKQLTIEVKKLQNGKLACHLT